MSRDPIVEAARGRRRGGRGVRGGHGGEEIYDEEHELELHPHVPQGLPGAGRFASKSHRQIADEARQTALDEGHPPEVADRIHRGVLARLTARAAHDKALADGHPPEVAEEIRRGVEERMSGEPARDTGRLMRVRDSEEEYRRRETTPRPEPVEEDMRHVTLIPDQHGIHHVYHGGRRIGRVAHAPNMPAMGRRGGEFDMPGAWRAQVQELDEPSTMPFHSDEAPRWVPQFGYERERGGVRRVPLDRDHPDTMDSQMSRWKTIGFGDSKEEAARKLLDYAPEDDEELEDEPTVQVTPHGRRSYEQHLDDPDWKEFADDVLSGLKRGLTFKQLVDEEMRTEKGQGLNPRRHTVELEVAEAIRHHQRTGRYQPPGHAERLIAKRRAEQAYEAARAKGMSRRRAVAIRDAVYRKLAPPNPQSIPAFETPWYDDVDPKTGLRRPLMEEAELAEARRRGRMVSPRHHHCYTPLGGRKIGITDAEGQLVGHIRPTGGGQWEAVHCPEHVQGFTHLGHHRSRSVAAAAVLEREGLLEGFVEAWAHRRGRRLKRRGRRGHIRVHEYRQYREGPRLGRELANFHHPDELARWLRHSSGHSPHVTIQIWSPRGLRPLTRREERDLFRRAEGQEGMREVRWSNITSHAMRAAAYTGFTSTIAPGVSVMPSDLQPSYDHAEMVGHYIGTIGQHHIHRLSARNPLRRRLPVDKLEHFGEGFAIPPPAAV